MSEIAVGPTWDRLREEAKSNPNFDKQILGFMNGPGGKLFAEMVHEERYKMMNMAAQDATTLGGKPMNTERWIGAMAGIEHVAQLWGLMIKEVRRTAEGTK